jgi:hypothetical protein
MSAPGLPSFTRQLVQLFLAEGFEVTHALGVRGYQNPPYFPNESFGRQTDRRPAVVAFDPSRRREVFGLVRLSRAELASEDSLEEYHLFLDRNADGGPSAAAVYVIFPEPLLAEFTGILTHEIHPEYWHRIVPVPFAPPADGPKTEP